MHAPGIHTITSSSDRGTRVITYFRRCDECGVRLGEFGHLAYEPRFVATEANWRWSPGLVRERLGKISPDVAAIEWPQDLAKREGAGSRRGRGLDFSRGCDNGSLAYEAHVGR